ncbi:uncharacterized protein LOC113205947 isoform X3 [Frankliniella occidentalis]|uniref:Uncharacterized protein LOC113205947 isoform X3 n=1 Tax=Frankliniella occidentalis TaxID=133901 RepID=A0A9C6U2R5_FRAOC|nr:uncharacterized protein LOC113205947 isoform X3 [Frankliniella occidentalis]
MYVLFPAEEIVLGPRSPSPNSRQRRSLCRYHRQLYEQQLSAQQLQHDQLQLYEPQQQTSQLQEQQLSTQLQQGHSAQDDILDVLVRASAEAREHTAGRPPASPGAPQRGRADRSPRSSARSSSSSRSRAAGSALALSNGPTVTAPGLLLLPEAAPEQAKKRSFLTRALRPRSAPPSPRLAHDRSARSTAAMAGSDLSLRELTHPQYNEPLQKHSSVTFRLVRTVSDFTTELSQLYERHAEELQMLVAGYRKRNAELRKDRGACQTSLFQTWDMLLQEVEKDSQAHSDIASVLGRQVARPLLEKTFHRKIQSRKVFGTREAYEQFVAKAEEKLVKARQDYKNAYMSYMASPNTAALATYFDAHNAYVTQLHATNGILEHFGTETLPTLMQELEDIYSDLCATLTDAALQGAEVISSRAQEQQRRYDALAASCRSSSAQADIVQVVRALAPQGAHPHPVVRRHFSAPHVPPPDSDAPGNDLGNTMLPPALKNELVTDRLASIQVRVQLEALRKEGQDLELQCKQLTDALDTLHRMQQRSLESALFNKANELQDEISVKKYDLRVAQMQMAAVRAQRELFGAKAESASDGSGRERKMSSSSTGSMKSKWLKAFKSLKTTGSSSSSSAPPVNPARESERKNGRDAALGNVEMGVHDFQEYTYKKITPCDVCSQVLRGHARQGVKCRLCKMNVHVDCKERVGRCTAKGRLLRRQKSSSEIESRLNQEQDERPEMDSVYQVLKQAQQATELADGRVLERAERGGSERVRRPPAPDGRPGLDGRLLDACPGIDVPPGAGAGGGNTLRRNPQVPLRGAALGSAQLSVGPMPHASSSGGLSSSLRSSRSATTLAVPSAGSSPASPSSGPSGLAGHAGPSAAPHSPRRQKLNLRMKSLSLDSPESTEHARRGRPANNHGHHGGTSSAGSGPHDPHSSHSSSSRLQSHSYADFYRPTPSSYPQHLQDSSFRLWSLGRRRAVYLQHGRSWSTPSSPGHTRRHLSARNMRMSSVELPDDNDKSSASTSPCPSPVRDSRTAGQQKSHRLLPTNLYVVLFNFKARHQDELDLKAGYKVTVIDTADQDWWKGKCLGRIGFFPSKYVTKIQPGERPLQVTHNLQVADGEEGLTLLRDQIVIQVGEELDGMVMIRSGDNRQGVCPLKFLQEV